MRQRRTVKNSDKKSVQHPAESDDPDRVLVYRPPTLTARKQVFSVGTGYCVSVLKNDESGAIEHAHRRKRPDWRKREDISAGPREPLRVRYRQRHQDRGTCRNTEKCHGRGAL